MRREDDRDQPSLKDATFNLAVLQADALNVATPTPDEVQAAVNDMLASANDARKREEARDDFLSQGGENPYTPGPPSSDAADWNVVAAKFRYFCERDHGHAEALAMELRKTREPITSGNLAALGQTSAMTSAWGGKARDAFLDGFLVPLNSKGVAAHQEVIGELEAAMWLYAKVLRSARADAKEIATKTRDALDAVLDFSSNEAKVVLSVVAIVLSLLTAAETGGTSLGIALALLSAGAATGTTAIDAAQTIKGDTVDGIMASLDQVLSNLKTAMTDAETAIGHALDRSREAVAEDIKSPDGRLLPGLVDEHGTGIADGVTPSKGDFGPKE